MIQKLGFCLFFLLSTCIWSQSLPLQFSNLQQGSNHQYRNWWDIQQYLLSIKVDAQHQFISGKNTITYRVVQPNQYLQIDLQAPMKIKGFYQNHQPLEYQENNGHYLINLTKKQLQNKLEKLTIYFEGTPHQAINAPWNGGWVWKKDNLNNPFIATANQQIGPSIWWPCKDHPSDEPNFGITFHIKTPKNTVAVSNGQLHKKWFNNYTWKVSNPINNYGISVNIANYSHFKEQFKGLNGNLNCDYYVLKQNTFKAKTHFKQVSKVLSALEHWLGPYPFYQDHYKLVETPYLGMEHQSAVAYGNGYQNGYQGVGLGTSAWGNLFDYIIVHETAHEWFANSITCNDVADLWIHESFATYAESLFVEYEYGKEAATEYILGLQPYVKNDTPITGTYNENKEGSTDMYFKGCLMLHTLRTVIDNDALWREILLDLNKTFYHKIINGKAIIHRISELSQLNLQPFFKQYLETTNLPVLTLYQEHEYFSYQWKNVVDGLEMKIKATLDNQPILLSPTTTPQRIKGKLNNLVINPNYYIEIEQFIE